MAALNNGKWSNEPMATYNSSGEFNRQASQFRETVNPEDVAPGRYHLYVSFACHWAHRTLIVRRLKKLENIIPLSVTNPYLGEKGWTFGSGHEVEFLGNVYRAAKKDYSGKITVPVLWDHRKETIVNNESSEIIRIFNSAYDAYTESRIDLYPRNLRRDINEVNSKIYEDINNGVYKAGFAGNQTSYDKACLVLFETLEEMDKRLGQQKFLVGEKVTEADIRFFTTLVRFDVVYYSHFKCNLRMIRDYENL